MLFKNPLPLPREAFFILKFHKLLYSLFSTVGALLLSLFSQDPIFFFINGSEEIQGGHHRSFTSQASVQAASFSVTKHPAAPELFTSEGSFRHYSELFHGRDLVVGRRFNLSTLTATGLHFEEKLIQSGLRSLDTMEQDVFPEWVWQFYSNAQFREDLLVTRVQGREVSFSTAVINQLLGTSQDGIFSFGEV